MFGGALDEQPSAYDLQTAKRPSSLAPAWSAPSGVGCSQGGGLNWGAIMPNKCRRCGRDSEHLNIAMSTMGHVQLCGRCLSDAQQIQAHIRLAAQRAAVDLILNGTASVCHGVDRRIVFQEIKA